MRVKFLGTESSRRGENLARNGSVVTTQGNSATIIYVGEGNNNLPKIAEYLGQEVPAPVRGVHRFKVGRAQTLVVADLERL